MNCYPFVLGTCFMLSSARLFKLNPCQQTDTMFGMSSRAEGNNQRPSCWCHGKSNNIYRSACKMGMFLSVKTQGYNTICSSTQTLTGHILLWACKYLKTHKFFVGVFQTLWEHRAMTMNRDSRSLHNCVWIQVPHVCLPNLINDNLWFKL